MDCEAHEQLTERLNVLKDDRDGPESQVGLDYEGQIAIAECKIESVAASMKRAEERVPNWATDWTGKIPLPPPLGQRRMLHPSPVDWTVVENDLLHMQAMPNLWPVGCEWPHNIVADEKIDYHWYDDYWDVKHAKVSAAVMPSVQAGRSLLWQEEDEQRDETQVV